MPNFYKYFLTWIMTRTKSITSVMSAHFLLDVLAETGAATAICFLQVPGHRP